MKIVATLGAIDRLEKWRGPQRFNRSIRLMQKFRFQLEGLIVPWRLDEESFLEQIEETLVKDGENE